MKPSLALVCFLFSFSAHAQWQSIDNKPGVTVNALHVANSALFAGTEKGVYKWNGTQWLQVLQNVNVTSLTSHDNYIFAGSKSNGIYRINLTTNNSVQVNNNLLSLEVTDVITHSGKLIAATRNGVFVSSDNGLQWENRSSQLGNKLVNKIAIYKDTVVAGTQGGVFTSYDEGIHWKLKRSGVVHAVTSTPSKIFAAIGSEGIKSSTDFGANWANETTGLSNMTVKAFFVDGNKLFAGTTDSLFVTEDINAIVWNVQKQTTPSLNISSIISHEGKLYHGNFFGVTEIGANGSVEKNNGLPMQESTLIFVDNNRLHLSTDKGVYSRIGGKWIFEKSFYPRKSLSSFSALDGGKFLADASGVYKYNNGWQQVLAIPNVPVVIKKDQSFFAATTNGVYRSTDNGNTFVPVNIGITGPAIKTVFAIDNKLFAVGNKLYRSDDNGNEWMPVGADATYQMVRVKDNVIYRTEGANTLYCTFDKSQDFGVTWTNVFKSSSYKGSYDYTVSSPLNFKIVSGKIFHFDKTNINASLTNDTVVYRFNKGYGDAIPNYDGAFPPVTVADVFEHNDTIFVRNTLNHLWKRSSNSFIPPNAPGAVAYEKNTSNVVTVNWLDQSANENEFRFRRYWHYADFSFPANTTSAVFDIDTADVTSFSNRVFLYANDHGDWSAFSEARLGLNVSPTISPVSDIDIILEEGQQVISLNGISDGDASLVQDITVTVTSSDETIVEVSEVTYSNGESNAAITLTPIAYGTSTITIDVKDSGSGANTKTIAFLVNVVMPVSTELASNEITVNPVPTSGKLAVMFPDQSKRMLSLFDELGRPIWKASSNEQSVEVDITSQHSGIYILRVNHGSSITFHKIIKH